MSHIKLEINPIETVVGISGHNVDKVIIKVKQDESIISTYEISLNLRTPDIIELSKVILDQNGNISEYKQSLGMNL